MSVLLITELGAKLGKSRTRLIREFQRFPCSFYDCTPLYSSIVTGRNPFGQDTSILDYEVDSEAEWEEGDDEQGEDLNEEVGEEEEEEAQDEDSDGWLAAEDDLGIDDEDEETREVRSFVCCHADLYQSFSHEDYCFLF